MDEFEYKGFKYRIVSVVDATVELISAGELTGKIVVPEEVEYQNLKYKVVGIRGARKIEYSYYQPDDKRRKLEKRRSDVYFPVFVGKSLQSFQDKLEVVLPKSLKKIGDYAFYWSGRHESIVIPNSVETIGKYAFANLAHNTSITVGSGVTTIGDSAFCRVVDTVYFKALNPPTINVCPFDGTPSAPICFIPCGTLDAYQSSAWANYMGEFIEEGCIDPTWQITYTSTDGNIITPYATDVFGANIVSNEYKDGQGVITFDGPVTSIGKEAFRECESLASITIPNSVTSIGDGAFAWCYSLTSITIPNSVTSIGSWAFRYCTSLTSMTVENGNTVYDSRENCNAIIETATNTLIAGCQNTIIPNSVTSIGDRAFFGCSSLTSITIPNSVTSIGTEVFSGCESLTSVTLGNSVTSIEKGAFIDSNIQEVTSYAATPPAAGGCGLNHTSCTLYVPAEYIDTYSNTFWWEDFKEIRAIAQYEEGADKEFEVVFSDQDNNELSAQSVTLRVPVAPQIEGFTFLYWQPVAAPLDDVITIQAVYESNTPTEAPEVFVNPSNPAQKLIRNGQVYILHEDKMYTISGQVVK